MKLKKVLACALALGILSGCGGDKTETKKEEPKQETKIEESTSKEEKEEEKAEEVVEEIDISDPKSIGKTMSNEAIEYKVTKAGYTSNSFKTGPFEITIAGASMGNLTVKDETLEAFTGEMKEVPSIIIAATIENTSDEKIDFFFGQSSLTTNTKEQLEFDPYLSQPDGEYLGNVEKDVIMVYHPKSNLDEIKEIKLYPHAPFSSEKVENVGEEITVTIKFNDKGEVESIS